MHDAVDFEYLLEVLDRAPKDIKVTLKRDFGKEKSAVKSNIFIRSIFDTDLTDYELWVCEVVAQAYILQGGNGRRPLYEVIADDFMQDGSPKGMFRNVLQILDNYDVETRKFRNDVTKTLKRCIDESHDVELTELGKDLWYWAVESKYYKSKQNSHSKWEQSIAKNCGESFLF